MDSALKKCTFRLKKRQLRSDRIVSGGTNQNRLGNLRLTAFQLCYTYQGVSLGDEALNGVYCARSSGASAFIEKVCRVPWAGTSMRRRPRSPCKSFDESRFLINSKNEEIRGALYFILTQPTLLPISPRFNALFF